MESEMVVSGAIVDSWVEATHPASLGGRVVLQVAPRVGRRISLSWKLNRRYSPIGTGSRT